MSENANVLEPEQRARLDALLAALEGKDTPDLLGQRSRFLGIDITDEKDRRRMDQTNAAAWAFNRSLHYLEKLRSVDDERIGLGKEMHRLQAIANSKRSSDVDRVAQAKVVLPHLSGTQELTFHFFAICIHHIRTLLVIASTEVEYTFEEDDVQFLDGYRILRNHYEHWGNRLPGGTNEDMMQIKRELNASTYRVTSQIEVDDQGLFVVYDRRAAGVPVPVHVEVSSGAVKRVERIVETAWLEIRRCALDDIERHLIEHPEEIIEPQQLRVISEVQVGRSIASTN